MKAWMTKVHSFYSLHVNEHVQFALSAAGVAFYVILLWYLFGGAHIEIMLYLPWMD